MCRESLYLLVLALVLGIRTYLSIRITGVNGEIVKAIVQRDFPGFLARLAILASIAIPASIVNSLLKYTTTHTQRDTHAQHSRRISLH